MLRKLSLIFYIFIFIIPTEILKANIEIKIKINDEIITNVDILEEKNYLFFLRPSLKSLPHKEINEIAKNSLIKEIIKRKELNRIFSNQNEIDYIEEIKKNLFNFKKVKNEKEFREILKNNELNYDKVINKVKLEGLWNELIFKKYNSMIKIDKKNLKKQLMIKLSKEKKYEYKISEILFEINKGETLNGKYEEILNYIKVNNFKDAASKYSIANSSNRGGQVGWIKETLLSEELIKTVKKTNINETTEVLQFPNGYLILKIEDKKEMKQKIDIDQELNELVNFEKNKQLNQFSLLYFKKLKQNSKINEY